MLLVNIKTKFIDYSPEIAQGMLVRQQAQALLDARKVVVEGAVSIVTIAVGRLTESGNYLVSKIILILKNRIEID
jgi:hypothetical protein